jgi:hypothetical protein
VTSRCLEDPVTKPQNPAAPTAHDIRKIAVAAVCAPRTVQRLYDGKVVRQTTAVRVLRAIQELDMPPPPPPATT